MVKRTYGKEEPSLPRLLREAKIRKQRTIHQMYTLESGTIQTSLGILQAFHEHFAAKYDTILTPCKQKQNSGSRNNTTPRSCERGF
jgi:hypothetical protein